MHASLSLSLLIIFHSYHISGTAFSGWELRTPEISNLNFSGEKQGHAYDKFFSIDCLLESYLGDNKRLLCIGAQRKQSVDRRSASSLWIGAQRR